MNKVFKFFASIWMANVIYFSIVAAICSVFSFIAWDFTAFEYFKFGEWNADHRKAYLGFTFLIWCFVCIVYDVKSTSKAKDEKELSETNSNESVKTVYVPSSESKDISFSAGEVVVIGGLALLTGGLFL